MKLIDLNQVSEYVDENIVDFHQQRITALQELQLEKLLTENPYLFQAKNVITSVGELVTSLLDDFLSSSEERLFGDFLRDLAVFIAGETCSGHQSAAPGVDLEFSNRGVHYIVSIKSGPNWGNTSQRRKLGKDLRAAVAQIKRSKRKVNIQPVLGLCYGKTKTTYLKGYLEIVGQNFWYMISEDKDLYTDIIDPISHRACEHNEVFDQERGKAINRFTRTFIDRFCSDSGKIDWVKLVEFNSGNYDLDTILA